MRLLVSVVGTCNGAGSARRCVGLATAKGRRDTRTERRILTDLTVNELLVWIKRGPWADGTTNTLRCPWFIYMLAWSMRSGDDEASMIAAGVRRSLRPSQVTYQVRKTLGTGIPTLLGPASDPLECEDDGDIARLVTANCRIDLVVPRRTYTGPKDRTNRLVLANRSVRSRTALTTSRMQPFLIDKVQGLARQLGLARIQPHARSGQAWREPR